MPVGPAGRQADPWTLTAFVAVVVLLGSNFVAVRFSNQELAPLWGAAIRFAIASGVLLVVVAALRIPLPRGAALRSTVLFGVLAFFATYALAYWGLVTAPAAMGAIAFATVPLVTLFLTAAVGLERLHGRGLAGAVVTLVGTGIAFFDQVRANVPPLAVLALLAGAVFAAASGVVVKRGPKTHPVAVNAIATAVGAGLLFLASVAVGEPLIPPSLGTTWATLGWLVMSTILAFVLFVWILGRWSASAASYTTVLFPFVTVLIAVGLLGEGMTVLFALGSGLTILGVYIGALSGKGAGPVSPSGKAPAPLGDAPTGNAQPPR
jgi:drug/metabolite transporter (DMT)-like permease